MSAQLNDVLYAERLGIPGKITVDEILELARPSIAFHNDVDLSGVDNAKQVLKNDGAGLFRKRTLNLNDLDDVNTQIVIPEAGWIMKHDGTEYVPAMRKVVRNRNIVVNTTTNLDNGVVIDQSFNFQRLGWYSFHLTTNYSGDSTGSDAQIHIAIRNGGGVLTPLSLISDGLILKEEQKDVTGNDGDGRGTSQKKLGSGKYYYEVTTLGSKDIVLRINSETDGVETATWETSIVVEEEFGIIEL